MDELLIEKLEDVEDIYSKNYTASPKYINQFIFNKKIDFELAKNVKR